jgi:type IV pilus assembly protein PilM
VHAVVDLGADQLTVAVHRRGQPRFIRAVGGLGGEAATAAMSERLRVDPDEAERIKRDCGLNGPAPVVVPIAESSVFAHASAPTAPALSPRDAAAVDILAGWATRVISEVRNSLDYFHAHQDDAQVSSVTLSGRTAALDGLVDRLAMQLQVPVLPAPALAGLSAARGVARKHGDDRGLVVAAGLAMSA